MSKEERIAALLKAVQEIPNDETYDDNVLHDIENELRSLRGQARELQLDLNL